MTPFSPSVPISLLVLLVAGPPPWHAAHHGSPLVDEAFRHPHQEAPRHEGRLSVVPVDFGTVSSTSGSGWVEAWIEDGTLRVEGSFEGTPTPATGAELRRGPPGVPGPAVAELEVQPDTAGTFFGDVERSDELDGALENGHLYVLLRTEGHPEGEIRGWIVPPDFPGATTNSRTSEASR